MNSGEMMWSEFSVVIAKETMVGGTCMSLKVPLMESLPPKEASAKDFCIQKAPNSAESGLPQRVGSLPSFSKYSWKVKRILW